MIRLWGMLSDIHKLASSNKKKLTIALTVWGSAMLIGRYVGLGINLTRSAPLGIYIYYPILSSLVIGDHVDFSLTEHQRKLSRQCIHKNEYGIKSIGAVSGQWLFTIHHAIYKCLNDQINKKCQLLGRCLAHDFLGRSIDCQHWSGYKIPNGMYYLMSNLSSRSCDSRYFGLVSRLGILHRVKLWLRLR